MTAKPTPFDDVTLTCGCFISTREVNGERQMIIKPCYPSCDYLAYALKEGRELGKEVRFSRDD